jgi:KUP system potassium uptake protein
VVHDQVILLTIQTEEVPYVEDARRVTVEPMREGFVRIVARYGFMERPDVVAIMSREDTPSPPLEYTTFFLGNETVLAESRSKMWRWRTVIFSFLARNAVRPTAFFNIPSRRIMEIGSQISF